MDVGGDVGMNMGVDEETAGCVYGCVRWIRLMWTRVEMDVRVDAERDMRQMWEWTNLVPRVL